MRRKTIAVLAIAFVAVSISWHQFVVVRDDLASQRNSIAEHWSRVEAALNRRADVIPMFLDPVQIKSGGGTAAALEISAARARLAAVRGPEEKIRANRELSLAIARLLLHCESDPQTRSTAGFRQLQDELRAREDEIARERFQYNNALEHYNARLRRFPVNIVASLAGYSRNGAYFNTGPDLEPALTHPK